MKSDLLLTGLLAMAIGDHTCTQRHTIKCADVTIPQHGKPNSFKDANPEHRKAKKDRLKKKRVRINKRGF